jgi:uncharacterized protein (TIGR03086 family)
MQTTIPDLAPAAAETARIVAGIRDDQLTSPTPCPGMSVATMLHHMVGLTYAFRMAAEKTPVEGAPSSSADELPDDWRTRIPAQLAALVAAWREPSAAEGMAEAGGVEMPAPLMSLVALDEVLVHGWDLAVATGQEYRPDPASTQACFDFVGDRSDEPADADSGLFGPVVPVPDDAPPFDRLLGRVGRDPRWAPSA